ncbi:MAG: NAD-dependent epimerase/dehydratase family protein [Acidimicrobiales bacterium]
MATALVVGGTGVTGPSTVDGLLRRGYDVTILHSGLHEAPTMSADVEHIHSDSHDSDAMNASLNNRRFDVGIAMYGRLRHVAPVLADRVDRFIAVGGVFYGEWINDQFHLTTEGEVAEAPTAPYTFPLTPMPESAPMDSNASNKFARLALESEELVMRLHAKERFLATLLRFPKVYGPGAIAPIEWSIVRRVLDHRPQLILPDGGMVLETKAYFRNASSAVLAVVDHADEASGEIFNIGDDRPVTTREWACLLASALGHDFEIVSIPFDLAFSSYPYARDPWTVSHHVLDLSKLRNRLSWEPEVSVEEGLKQTALYLAQHPPSSGGEEETQVGDPFDYETEDAVIQESRQYKARLDSLSSTSSSYRYRHPYRHPARSVPSE